MTISICSGEENNSCSNHLIRVYLSESPHPQTGAPISALDILVSNSENGDDFLWVSKTKNGDARQDTLLTTRADGDTYQVPASAVSGPSPIKLSPALTIDDETKKDDKEFTLEFDIRDLFFYDETDKQETSFFGKFNLFAVHPIQSGNNDIGNPDGLSRDGTVEHACDDPTNCTTPADFYPGDPAVTVTWIDKGKGKDQ